MNDTHLIARQLQRELNQGEEARRRLNSSTKTAEQKTYASSTIYGRKLLASNVGRVGKRLKERLKVIGRGRGAVDAETVYQRLKDADHDIVAVLTMKVALDVLAGEMNPRLCEIAVAVGAAVEVEMRLSWYKKQDPDLYKHVSNRFHNSTGTRQKVTVYKLRFNQAGLQWPSWGRAVHFKVGNWCLDSLASETGWLYRTVRQEGKKKSEAVRFTQEFLDLREAILERALDLAYCLWPMLCEPIPWSNEDRGGFLTETIRQSSPMVRGSGFEGPCMQGTLPIEFLNNLQRTKYRINREILDVAEWAYEKGYTVGKFVRKQAMPAPEKPPEDATEEQIKEYKRERRKREDDNAQIHQKNYRTTDVMFVARLYRDEEFFTIPWSFCFRGRVYPLLTSLNPQGTEWDRSLLYFAEEGPVNEWWLAWHLATTAGQDRLPNEQRVQWTRSRINYITAIATNPYSNRQWMDADEPWSHLAAIQEYYSCCIAKTKLTSGLPCGIDATMSGLQHLSAATLDREAGALVNLTPTEQKADGYKVVADEAIKHIEDPEIHPFIDRKTVKRVCMTFFYSAQRTSARDYLKSALHEKGFDLSIPGRLKTIVDAVYEKAVPTVFSGPVGFMDWVQSCVPGLLERGDVISWTTHSGFKVVQNVRHSLTERIKTRILGDVVKTNVGVKWGKPNQAKHLSSISPNVVHSWDSALLHLAFAYFDKPFFTIHDCVLGRSCDMDEMSHCIRQEFVEMYKSDPLQDLADQWGVLIPDGLMKNTLDIEQVNDSKYFFC